MNPRHLTDKGDALVAHALDTPLDQLSSFLERAATYPDLVEVIWEGLSNAPEKLLERAWKTPLEHLSTFIERASGWPDLVAQLWEGLARNPETLLARALESRAEYLSTFINCARNQTALVTELWEGLLKKPDRIRAMTLATRCHELAAFLRTAPNAVVQIAVEEIKPDHWDATPSHVGLNGATSLAPLCEAHGRSDLAEGIKTCLLKRSNPADHTMTGAFGGVAWLVSRAPETDLYLIPRFLAAVCTDEWLRLQYRYAFPTALARGLRILGVEAKPEVVAKFEHSALGLRASRELRAFEQVNPMRRNQTIQLIGCAALVDWWAPKAWLLPHKVELLAELPVHVQPHREEAAYVESFQYHLWLGLRVYALTTKRRIPVGSTLIQQTLNLFAGNVTQRTSGSGGAALCLDQSMIRWLTFCLADGRGELLPDGEWVGDVCRREKERSAAHQPQQG